MINTLIKILYKIAGNVEKYGAAYYTTYDYTVAKWKFGRIIYDNYDGTFKYGINSGNYIKESFPNEISKLEFLKAMENLNQACIECTKSQFISFADAREETDEID